MTYKIRCFAFLFLLFIPGLQVLAQWVPTSFPVDYDVNDLQSTGKNLYVATAGGGVFASVDQEGDVWIRFLHELLPADARWVVATDTLLVVAGSYSAPVCSVDGGLDWMEAGQGLGGGAVELLKLSCDGVLGASLGRLMRFEAAAREWEVYASTPQNEEVCQLSCHYPYLLCGTRWQGPYYSPNWGGYWVQGEVEGGALPVFLSVVEINEVCFAASMSSGLFRSNDFGGHWVALNTGLPCEPMTLAVWKECMFAAGRSGVWLSTNLGETWSNWSEGLPIPIARMGDEPVLLVEGGFLFAGGGGIWKRSLNEALAVSELAQSGAMPSPNPGTGLFEVKGSVAGQAYEVFDQSGRCVARGNMVDGSINLQHLVQGSYILSTSNRCFRVVVVRNKKNM